MSAINLREGRADRRIRRRGAGADFRNLCPVSGPRV